uniref:D4472 protein n=1 Tax=Saccharomyces cerevisiae TaxID=4932 RepID=E9PA61_YEASX|nr:D4472 [Saccharomyces cerevisiae]
MALFMLGCTFIIHNNLWRFIMNSGLALSYAFDDQVLAKHTSFANRTSFFIGFGGVSTLSNEESGSEFLLSSNLIYSQSFLNLFTMSFPTCIGKLIGPDRDCRKSVDML